jgi:hypothetical protein
MVQIPLLTDHDVRTLEIRHTVAGVKRVGAFRLHRHHGLAGVRSLTRGPTRPMVLYFTHFTARTHPHRYDHRRASNNSSP